MSGVYFYDLLARNDPSRRRKLFELDPFITSLFPSNLKSIKSIATTKGFIYTFPRDNDVNTFFTDEVKSKLTEKNLTVDLIKQAQTKRTLFIYDICQENFNKDNEEIKSNIESQNNIKIMQITKFEAKDSKRLYVKIYLEKQVDTYTIVPRGKLKVFNENLHARIMNPPTEPPATAAAAGPHSRAQPGPPNPAQLGNYPALAPSSNWAGPRPHTTT